MLEDTSHHKVHIVAVLLFQSCHIISRTSCHAGSNTEHYGGGGDLSIYCIIQ